MSQKLLHININIIKELKTLALRNKEPITLEQRNSRRLAAKIIMLFEDGRTMTNNWGFYLFSDELKSEPQLRNKITTIMISGLFNIIEAENQVINDYIAEARKSGYFNMINWCEKAREWCMAAKGVLKAFSKEVGLTQTINLLSG